MNWFEYCICGGKDDHGVRSRSKNGRDVYKRGTGIVCMWCTTLFDILDIAYLIGIDVHLLLLETNSTVAIARHGQHCTSFALNMRYTVSMCRISWAVRSRDLTSHEICATTNMRGVLAREPTRAPREITWRKQSDRRVNLRHIIQCQIASHIPTARVTSHKLTWREDSVSPA
jgi:hypothetical protein